MKLLKYISGFVLLLLCTRVQSQDIHFSQFSQSPLLINPADAGFFSGDLRLIGHHKRQWSSISVPYKTFAFSADAKLAALHEMMKGFGAGLQLLHDQAGDGQLTSIDVKLFLSYRIALRSDSIHFIRAGIMGGFCQRNIDFNKLTFDGQFDGDVFNPVAASGEPNAGNTSTWADVGFGFGWDMIRENASWQAGCSAVHINKPDQGFYTEVVRRPVLWQINTGGQINMNSSLLLIPSVVYMLQEKFRELNFGAEVKVNLQPENARPFAIGFAIHDRWNDALIPALALYSGKFRLGFSYDINTSPLKTVSNSRGGPEFSIVYISRKIKAQVQRNVICPVY